MPLGLWWSHPRADAPRHLAALTGDRIVHSADETIYFTACYRRIVRAVSDPHPADSAHRGERRPCAHCLTAVRRHIAYYEQVLAESESPATDQGGAS